MKWQDLVSKTVETLAKRASGGADVRGASGWNTEVTFENNKLKSITAAESTQLDVRVISDGRLGAAGTNKLSLDGVEEMMRNAVEVSSFGAKATFTLPGKKIVENKVKSYDESLEKVQTNDLVKIGNRLIEKILKTEPEMMVNYLGFSTHVGEGIFENTLGRRSTDIGTGCDFGIEISKVTEGDFFQIWNDGSSVRNDLDYDKLVDEILEFAIWGRKIATVKSGKMKVVFAPDVVRQLVGYLTSSLNGKLVNEGVSKLVGKQGTKVCDSRITLIEDPKLDWGLASTVIDDEGVETAKKELVNKGVLTSYYYDLAQAKKAGVASTGNGFRQPFFQADPSLTNVLMTAGELEYAKLLRAEEEVLVVYQVLGAGQNNPYNGDFQLGINLGYLVRKGEVVGRVKDTAIAGNAFELLDKGLRWLSTERKLVGSYQIPYMCLDGVSVTGK